MRARAEETVAGDEVLEEELMVAGAGVQGAWAGVNEGAGELLKVREGLGRGTLRLKTVVVGFVVLLALAVGREEREKMNKDGCKEK